MYFIQEADERLEWQEKTTSSLTAQSASSTDQAARTIGPMLEVCGVFICIWVTKSAT